MADFWDQINQMAKDKRAQTTAGGNLGQNQAGMNMTNRKVPKSLSKYDQGVPKDYSVVRTSNYTPEQHQLYQQMFGHVSPQSYLSRLASGDQSQFAEMEAPAMRQFQELQGQNASRFSNAGMGARHGSGFKNSQDAATSNFAQDLAARRMDMQRQAIRDLMGLSGDLLHERPYQTQMYQKPPKKKRAGAGSWIGMGVGGVAGAYFGGPMGAMAGANAGKQFGSMFDKGGGDNQGGGGLDVNGLMGAFGGGGAGGGGGGGGGFMGFGGGGARGYTPSPAAQQMDYGFRSGAAYM